MRRMLSILTVLSIAFITSFSWSREFRVHPAGKGKSAGKVIYGISQINFQISPDDSFLLYDDNGPYKEDINVSFLEGSPQAPITIKAAPGEHPIVEGSVVFIQSAYIILEGIKIMNSPHIGVAIKQGSHHISISKCVINNNGLGIWIGDDAGMENIITENSIFANKTHGIAAALVNCTSGKETIMSKNHVYDNGYHGFEINGDYYIIEENKVFNNGKDHVGSSGIHIFSKSLYETTGNNNIIRYNTSFNNLDVQGPDGNGIQLDQWCDNNQVYYNICYNNDGAGISMFDSSSNTVYNNILFKNMQDPGKTHPYKGELVLASDYTKNVDHTRNLTISNNIIVAVNSSAYAIYVDKLTSDNPLKIQRNLFFHTEGNDFYFWKDKSGLDIKELNSFPACSENLYQNPFFLSDLQKLFPMSPVKNLKLEIIE